MVAAPGGSTLYVTTSDCDLQDNGGTVQALDLTTIRENKLNPLLDALRQIENGKTVAAACATVLTGSMAHAQQAWRELPVGTVKINAVFGGAPGGAAEPRGTSGSGFGYGPELLDEMTTTKVVHWSPLP